MTSKNRTAKRPKSLRKARKVLIQFLADVTKEREQWALLSTEEIWICAQLEVLTQPKLLKKLKAMLKEAK